MVVFFFFFLPFWFWSKLYFSQAFEYVFTCRKSVRTGLMFSIEYFILTRLTKIDELTVGQWDHPVYKSWCLVIIH